MTTTTSTATSINSLPSLVTDITEDTMHVPLDSVAAAWLTTLTVATVPTDVLTILVSQLSEVADNIAPTPTGPALPFQNVSPAALDELLSAPVAVSFTDEDVVMVQGYTGVGLANSDEAVGFE